MFTEISRLAAGTARLTLATALGVADAAATLAAPLAPAAASTRRRWIRDGRAHIEMRSLADGEGQDGHRALSEDVTAALRKRKGVYWAEVNAVTRQVLVAFDEDAVDADELIETVAAVEEEHGAREPFDRAGPDLPWSDAPVRAAAAALAADVAGLGVAWAGKAFRWPAAPPGVRVPLVIAETYPRVRGALEDRLGPARAELLLSVSSAALHAVSQGTTPLVSTVQATRCGSPRPGPAWPFGIGARPGAFLALARDPGRAAELMLATMPKTARRGREAFASVLGWHLARSGVVPMDATALRRLDRVSVVVVDSSVLCTARLRILSAVAAGPARTDGAVWRIAETALIASGHAARMCWRGRPSRSSSRPAGTRRPDARSRTRARPRRESRPG